MAKPFRFKIELFIESNSKKEVLDELSELVLTMMGQHEVDNHFSGGTNKTNVKGYIKKPKYK